MKTAKHIAHEIMEKLADRKGFDHWWHNIDDEIQDEIIEEVAGLITPNQLEAIREGMTRAAEIVHKANLKGYDCYETLILTARDNLKSE